MEQTVYLGTTTTDIVVYTQAIDSSGSHVALVVDTSTTKLVFANGTQSSVVPSVTSLGTGKAKITFASVTNSGNLAAGDSVCVKVNGSANSVNFSEYLIPVFIDSAGGGGGSAPTEAQIYTYFTSLSREDAFKADVTSLATSADLAVVDTNVDSILVDTGTDIPAQISALNNFDPAVDTVTVGTNNDKTGYSISGIKTTLDALNDVAATDIVSAGAITTLNGAVANVDLVDVTTSNADMRGTDSSLTSADVPSNFASLGINASGHISRVTLVDSNADMRGTDGANTVAPDNAGITANGAAINALNNLSNQDVENAVWDSSYSAHLQAGTFGKLMDLLRKANRAIDAEVAGTPTASAFDTNLSGYVDGAFDHELVVFTSGALNGEARPILSYSATNGRITFEEPLTSAPSASDEFVILPYHTTPTSEIQDGLVTIGTQFTYTNQAGDSHQVTIS